MGKDVNEQKELQAVQNYTIVALTLEVLIKPEFRMSAM